MTYTYEQMKTFLDSRNTTHEEMQERWDSLKGTNWKVKNLSEHGKNWTDLIEPALDNLIELASEPVKRKENGE